MYSGQSCHKIHEMVLFGFFFPVWAVLYLIIVSENINSGEAKGEMKEEAKGK